MQSFPLIRNGRRIAIGVFTLVFLAGCAVAPPLYSWGAYEQIIYAGYKDPGSSIPTTDAELLEADIARTEAEGKQVPPGVRIHLGYLYYNAGRDAEARAMFETERQVFPESAVFVDRLLATMGGQ